MVLRLVSAVPAQPVHVAPILVEPMHDVFVLLVSLTMHLHGPLERGAGATSGAAVDMKTDQMTQA